METINRPFEIKLTDIGEMRMGSPYNICKIELVGRTKIELPKTGWQDIYAWTEDSSRLVLVKWNLENDEPSFNLYLIDTVKGMTLESPKIFGLPENISVIGDTVKFKKFLYDKTKSFDDCYFNEEYQFNW